MTSLPLAGKRIAVVVESQYIPGEVALYRQRFADYGASVELVSRLWGRPSGRFYSTVEVNGGEPTPLEYLDVDIDIEKVTAQSYAAVVLCANYVTVRLRWLGDVPVTTANAAERVRTAPAVDFLRQAMVDDNIIKAAPCHALWLLTPTPELLAGRRVTCNQVVLADVLNAGGVYVPPPDGPDAEHHLVVDRDLVTSTSWHATEALIDRVRDLILDVDQRSGDGHHLAPGLRAPSAPPFDDIARSTARRMAAATFAADDTTPFDIPTAGIARAMAGGEYGPDDLAADIRSRFAITGISRPPEGSRVLAVAAEHGVWASELALPLRALEAAGYDVHLATLTGRAPMFLPASLDQDFRDPTWGAGWVAPGEADLGWQVQTELLAREHRGEIISLDEAIPVRPQAAQGSSAVRDYEERLARSLAAFSDVRALLVPGGTGAILDLADNSQLEALLGVVHDAGRPIVTVCYGTLAALYAYEGALMRGVCHTIHNRADDFVTGTAGLTDEGVARLRAHVQAGDRDGFVADTSAYTSFLRSPTIKAELVAEAIGGPGRQVVSPYTPDSCAVIDARGVARGTGPIVTGRSIHCGYDAALAMIAHELGDQPLPASVLVVLGSEGVARRPGPQDLGRAGRWTG